MEPDEAKVDSYIKLQRMTAYMNDPPEGWTMGEWIKRAYHYNNGTKVYHSYADYCDD